MMECAQLLIRVVGQAVEHNEVLVLAMVFSENGEYLVSSHYGGVRVWGVEVSKEMATLKTNGKVDCLGVSKDGSWIAAGNWRGDVFVWDANTYEQKHTWNNGKNHIVGVDFSPDSTHLVAASMSFTATIWDIATGKVTQNLYPEDPVLTAKYSPQGDRIATATNKHVLVWDRDGRLLAEIPVQLGEWRTTRLVWCNDLLVVASGNEIKKIEEASTVSEWAVPNSEKTSHIALQNHGEFVACATTTGIVTFWNTSTHAQLGFIRHDEDVESIALSSDDRFIAVAGKDGKITIKRLSHITVSTVFRWIILYFNLLELLTFPPPGHFSIYF